jgi:hypothetical protein
MKTHPQYFILKPRRSFRVGITHPILQGLPRLWMHAPDELCGTLRGPGLATAHSDPSNNGTGFDDPMLMVLLHIPKWPRLFGAVSPTANARHLVVGSPIREGIIGGMNYDEAAAIAHVLLEMCLQYDASFWVVNRPVLLTSLGLAPETANSTASPRAETPSAQLGSHPGRRD